LRLQGVKIVIAQRGCAWRITWISAFIACVIAIAPGASAQDERAPCGKGATVDEDFLTRLTAGLAKSGWTAKTHQASSVNNQRLLQLARDGVSGDLGMSFMATPSDAAQQLQCRLQTISQPSFRRLAGLGDEAYVISPASGGLLLRIGTLVFSVHERPLWMSGVPSWRSRSLEREREVADIIVSAQR
jgi:hypothetical protein